MNEERSAFDGPERRQMANAPSDQRRKLLLTVADLRPHPPFFAAHFTPSLSRLFRSHVVLRSGYDCKAKNLSLIPADIRQAKQEVMLTHEASDRQGRRKPGLGRI